MKPLSEQDHYEILEMDATCTPAELERAFRLAMATYSADGLAAYSVLDESDTDAMRERIEIAYRVLSDAEARREYDASLSGAEGKSEEAEVEPENAAEPIGDEVLEGFDDDSSEFDGARLRRTRMRRGVEIDQIAAITKINPHYLRFLEEERFADLPAAVYVRGFVSSYASCIGLDGPQVAKSYMERLEASQQATAGTKKRRDAVKRSRPRAAAR